jgi:hypothetical protein
MKNSSKTPLRKTKSKPKIEHYLAVHISDKELLYRITKRKTAHIQKKKKRAKDLCIFMLYI